MGLTDETGVPRAVIESEDEAMREWFQSTFEMYRAEADPVTVEALTVSTEVEQNVDSASSKSSTHLKK